MTIEDKEVAVNRHNPIPTQYSRNKPLILHVDGSEIEGRIGAATTVDLEGKYAHRQMVNENTSYVYAAELRAIEITLRLIVKSMEMWAEQAKNRLVKFADSSAAAEGAPPTMDTAAKGTSGRMS